MPVNYYHIDHTGLEVVEPLWNELVDHHGNISRNMNHPFSRITFHERSKELLSKVEHGQLQIILAIDDTTNKHIGYCISSITKKGEAEIDSIYVSEDYRSNGIGASLINQSIEWIENQKAESISISVIYGNERAIRFYEKYGFYLRSYILKNRMR
ncbi:GNAT family N-acetyltransferase [Paenibacillus wynnii]|uniref:GNAT family N-acetyltransferase n=1 Tax=Paenibacillus wynnii TaxID=268407 RepID=UPI002790D7C6|nr:GNAT family N-acetyltransferase [Paenibacillus wynnii]MDQ0195563.1 ribosomal protein S18 acetylase RimI-like enzyme [Paenibacillus wynnii]